MSLFLDLSDHSVGIVSLPLESSCPVSFDLKMYLQLEGCKYCCGKKRNLLKLHSSRRIRLIRMMMVMLRILR